MKRNDDPMENKKPPVFVFVFIKNREPVEIYLKSEHLFRDVKLFYGNKFHDALQECYLLMIAIMNTILTESDACA